MAPVLGISESGRKQGKQQAGIRQMIIYFDKVHKSLLEWEPVNAKLTLTQCKA